MSARDGGDSQEKKRRGVEETGSGVVLADGSRPRSLTSLATPLLLFSCKIVFAFCLAASAAAETIVFLGDSLTAGYGLDESQAYPALVQQALRVEHPSWTVVNAGVSGDTSAGALRRTPWVLKTKPQVVFIAIGANDGMRGQPLDNLERNLRAIVGLVQAAGATPVLAGMRLPANLGEDYRNRFAALYLRIAEETKTTLMPFLLDGVAMDKRLNQGDGIHPNAEGQQAVARNVLTFLAPLLSSRRLLGGEGPTGPKRDGASTAGSRAQPGASGARGPERSAEREAEGAAPVQTRSLDSAADHSGEAGAPAQQGKVSEAP